ncbi:MAG: diguanylate cyclase [Gammaproteobacteria bacterium]
MTDPYPRGVLPPELALPILARAGEAICLVDGRQSLLPIVWVNPAFERLTGYAASEVLGKNPRFLQGGDRDQAEIAGLRRALEAGEPVTVTLRNYRSDGSMFWNELRLEPLEAAGGLWWVGFSRDISVHRQMATDLGRRRDELEGLRSQLSQVDPLDRVTGLYNHRKFEAELERTWFICAREKRPIALFDFAPDFFDFYRETFGSTAADSCLRMVGRAISGCFRRASDVVARTDEVRFCALAVDMDGEKAMAHADRVISRARELSIHNPRSPGGRFLTLSAAVAVTEPGPGGGLEAFADGARRARESAQARAWETVVRASDGASGDGPEESGGAP